MTNDAPSTATATLAMHPHAFAVVVLERPADQRFTADVAADPDIEPAMVAAMLRGIAFQIDGRA